MNSAITMYFFIHCKDNILHTAVNELTCSPSLIWLSSHPSEVHHLFLLSLWKLLIIVKLSPPMGGSSRLNITGPTSRGAPWGSLLHHMSPQGHVILISITTRDAGCCDGHKMNCWYTMTHHTGQQGAHDSACLTRFRWTLN